VELLVTLIGLRLIINMPYVASPHSMQSWQSKLLRVFTCSTVATGLLPRYLTQRTNTFS
jgi:hypothetical protein